MEFIIKLIKLLKPKFYEKITWGVIITGFGLMTTPWWGKALVALVKQKYGVDLATEGSISWGFALVCVGLFYHLVCNAFLLLIEYMERKGINKKSTKHDSNIFIESQKILKDEFLDNFFYFLLTDHSFESDDAARLRAYVEYHKLSGNHYIDSELQRASTELAGGIVQLLVWLAGNFWVFPDNQTNNNMRLCMHPHWNVDREGQGKPGDHAKYDEVTYELQSLSDEVMNSYKSYRILVKKKLFI